MNRTATITLAQPRGAVRWTKASRKTHPVKASGQGRRGDAQVGQEPERATAERDDPVDGQAEQGPEGVLRLAQVAGVAVVGDADLAEADEGSEPPDEPGSLGEGVERGHDPAVHQAEVARVERDGEVGHRAQHAIEGEVPQPLRPALLAGLADGVGDVEPPLPAVDERGDHLGGILQVAVHHHHGAALGVVEPGGHGRLVAEVPAQGDHADPRVEALEVAEDRGRGVGAPVVDEHDLERQTSRPRVGGQAIEQRVGGSPPRRGPG